MNQICRITGQEFEITEDDLKFYEKMDVPIPTLCPEERQRRRVAFINVERLYHGKSSLSQKAIISPYSADKNYNVVLYSEWLSNDIDGLKYGRDFNFSRSFFEQFKRLQQVAPRWDRTNHQAENSEWSLNNAFAKNTYLLRGCENVENGFYSQKVYHSSYFSDVENSESLELCYEILNSKNLYQVQNAQESKDVSFSVDVFNVQSSKYCLCCVGLRNKSYHVLNKKVTPDEFSSILVKYKKDKGFREMTFSKYKQLKKSTPRRNLAVENCENCLGDELSFSKNVQQSYSIRNSEDIKFCESGANTKSTYDSYGPDQQELSYETSSNYQLYNCRFIFNSTTLSNCDYCETSSKLKDCFGCVGLRNVQYCILNKQYSKEEYFELKAKIIEHMSTGRRSASGGQNPSAFQENPLSSQARDLPFKKGEKMQNSEWGEFFPIEMSPFGYNETVAQEYFPLTKEQALEKGYTWKDEEEGTKYTGPKVNIPDSIHDTDETICNAILECEQCSKNYRIVKPEYEFYKKMALPVPHKCPNCRHLNRMKLRNPRKLWKRNCSDCSAEIQTTFAPERPEKVLCEKCYLAVVE